MAIDKHRGKWRARWRDASGIQRAKTFDRKADAQAHMAAIVTAKRTGHLATEPTTMTIAALADEWLAAKTGTVSASTIETYRRDLDRYILDAFGGTRAAKLTPSAIQKWLSAELAAGYAPSSVHRHYRILRSMFAWAVKMKLMVENPCDPVTPPKVPRTDLEVFTVEQVEKIASVITPRYRAFVLIAAYGGLRFSELVGLRRRDIDGPTITVNGQLRIVNGEWVRTEPKTAAGRRRVTLPPSVAAEVAAHLDEFTGPEPDDLVFTNQHGRPVGPSFRGNNWPEACTAAGMGRRTIKNHKPAYEGVPRFHDLRHTSVALAIAAGAHPKAIQQRAGHSSIGVTMDTYGHLMAGMDAELADRLDAMRPDTGD